MALVSPGVEVTVTNESFFIPATAPTVPLLFVATASEKLQPDGTSDAEGTFEHDVVRTVTSLKQSTELYGVPRFLEDSSGNQQHGDARNEYGVFALNQFLGVGNRAYVVRANVNLNDNIDDLRTMWDSKIQIAQTILENKVNQFISDYNTSNNLIPSDPGYKQTVSESEFVSLVNDATSDLFDLYSFSSAESHFLDDHTIGSPASPLLVYSNGYEQPSTGTYAGLAGIAADWVASGSGGTVATEWTATEAGTTLVNAADDFKYTQEFLNDTRLGANDSARRTAITTALQATINSNTEVRSDSFEFNLILCPGYPEVADELLALSTDIGEEALVIGDTPVDESPDGITNPSTGWAQMTARQRSVNIAYYYPWALASNLDGKNVVVAPSGVALRTYANSDNMSYLWFAPAGSRRGVITGISNLGYVSGTLGTATTFVETNINRGQMNALYGYSDSGDINPLIFRPGSGFLVWGQKTSAPDPSAMDRVNVSRLVKYIKRRLRKDTMSFVFQPNDQLTRDNLKATVDSFLGDLIVKRGLYDFATVCDESNNTPDRIDRNEMYIDVAVKPVKAAEFIYIPLRVVSTGAEI